ncbi:MAG: hypothetical protein IIY06_11615 [Proteobacteria bacterium]|nr:hypothetical protein [Pseudomonadota bacterium]
MAIVRHEGECHEYNFRSNDHAGSGSGKRAKLGLNRRDRRRTSDCYRRIGFPEEKSH